MQRRAQRDGPLVQVAVGLDREPRGALQHESATSPSTPMTSGYGLSRAEAEQREEVAGELAVGVERHAADDVADRDAEQQRRHRAAEEERPVPDARPVRVVRAELERRPPGR